MRKSKSLLPGKEKLPQEVQPDRTSGKDPSLTKSVL